MNSFSTRALRLFGFSILGVLFTYQAAWGCAEGKTAIQLGKELSNNILQRYQPTINAAANNGWDHANSTVLHGMENIYQLTGDQRYLQYIKGFVDSHLNEDASIKGLELKLDAIHPGVLLLFLYDETGENKYLEAATNLRNFLLGSDNQISEFHQTPNGGYWHKVNDKYRDVMTVDGTYMAYPFLLRYGLRTGDQRAIDTALEQVILVSDVSLSKNWGLPYHAWSYRKNRAWANPETGRSSQFWSRASGWYAMALVDMLEVLPHQHPHYPQLQQYFLTLISGLLKVQDKRYGYWWHVMDKSEVGSNYPEMAGTGMIVYALAKGRRLGLLDERAARAACLGWDSMQPYLGAHSDGGLKIHSLAPGMGVQNDLEGYLAVRPVTLPRPEGKQHTHGYVAFILAAAEMSRIQKPD